MKLSSRRSAVGIALASVLAGCGGGGEQGSVESPASAESAGRSQSTTPHYSIADIGAGVADATYSRASAVNNRGQVVGFYETPTSGPRSFLYSGKAVRDLGPLASTHSVALGVNDKTAIVGGMWSNWDPVSPRDYHAFFYFNGVANEDICGDFDNHGQANDINNGGSVVGYCSGPNGWGRAVLYRNGVTHDLGTLGVGSVASAINSKGDVVGLNYFNNGLDIHAFAYTNGLMRDLGTLGGAVSSASDINDEGQIVGSSFLAGPFGSQHAILYEDGRMRDLGTLGGGTMSWASGINNRGHVVGSFTIAGDIYVRAFVYRNGAMVDLNDLLDETGAGWTIYEATAINDSGQIVGTGVFNGQDHAFIMTPSNGRRASGRHLADVPVSMARNPFQDKNRGRLEGRPCDRGGREGSKSMHGC